MQDIATAADQHPVPMYRNIPRNQACHNHEVISDPRSQSLLFHSLPLLSVLPSDLQEMTDYTTELGSLYVSSWHCQRTQISGHLYFIDKEIRAQKVLNILPKATGLENGKART